MLAFVVDGARFPKKRKLELIPCILEIRKKCNENAIFWAQHKFGFIKSIFEQYQYATSAISKAYHSGRENLLIDVNARVHI